MDIRKFDTVVICGLDGSNNRLKVGWNWYFSIFLIVEWGKVSIQNIHILDKSRISGTYLEHDFP